METLESGTSVNGYEYPCIDNRNSIINLNIIKKQINLYNWFAFCSFIVLSCAYNLSISFWWYATTSCSFRPLATSLWRSFVWIMKSMSDRELILTLIFEYRNLIDSSSVCEFNFLINNFISFFKFQQYYYSYHIIGIS